MHHIMYKHIIMKPIVIYSYHIVILKRESKGRERKGKRGYYSRIIILIHINSESRSNLKGSIQFKIHCHK